MPTALGNGSFIIQPPSGEFKKMEQTGFDLRREEMQVANAEHVATAASRESKVRIAVLVPCYNEALTIADVVRDFRRYLPGAAIYVFDNNSRDETKAVARAAGAVVSSVAYQGKGNVIRRMFADVEADVYVLTTT